MSVHDHDSSGEPVVPSEDPDRTSGRGALLMDALADGWETHHQADGKTVTACFVPPDHPGPYDSGTQ